MRFVYFTFILILFQIKLFGQIVHGTLKSDIIYFSEQLKNHYIIELDTKPVSFRNIEATSKKRYKPNSRNYNSYRSKLINENLKRINTEQSDFLNAFNKADLRINKAGNYKKQILRQYKSALNGFSVEADSFTINDIRKLPHVRRVIKDRIIKINDSKSNDVIGAPLVWQQTGATGKNIIIGILDTGIDPDHPDLKGRVLRGYDFVNNDTIPYDDHGHGTHCAGIAAANGPTLKGVAPDALLLPIKVLNASGTGSWSDIISGVNYALDPDGDALTDDGVKILSISLGGPGSPDDPLAEAINNAFEKNVLCVVAAGNDGNRYYDIGSPGCAEKALTVGATDDDDNLAEFSSCGPIKGTFQVKPEVLAPGVAIYSTLPGGNYASWSGTSMATPHVSGAAALLMELHPDWSPSEVKAAFMETATDIGLDIWKQGKGRINVLKAAFAKTFVNPDIISFGNVSDSSSICSKSQILKVYNKGGTSKDYAIKVLESLPSGISMSYPGSINVSDSLSIKISISVDLNKYQFTNYMPSAFQDKLLLISSADSIIVPFVINRAHIAKIIFNKIPDALYIHDNESFANIYYPYDSIYSFVIDNSGEYNFIACFDNYTAYVIKENVFITTNTSVYISSDEAKNEITFSGIDQNGENVPIMLGPAENLSFKGTNAGLKLGGISFYSDDYTKTTIKRKISDLSDKYRWDLEYISNPTWNKSQKAYWFPFEFSNGVTENKTVTNSKTDFLTVTRKFPGSFSRSNVYLNYNYFTSGNVGSVGNMGFTYKGWKELEKGNIFTDYVLPFPSKEFQLRGTSYYSLKERKGNIEDRLNDSIVFATGNEIFISKDTLSISNLSNDNNLIHISDNSISIGYGISPGHYIPVLYSTGDKILIEKRGPAFYNASFDLLPGKIDYKVTYSGEKDSSGIIYNDIYGKTSVNDYYQYIEMSVNTNLEKIEFTYQSSRLDDYNSISKATHYWISGSFIPCSITDFQFKEDGTVTDHLRTNHKNTIEIKSTSAKSIQLLVKRVQDSIWNNISLNKDALLKTQWNGTFPVNLKKGYYDAKLVAYNPSYDSLVYTAEPAFVIFTDSCNKADPTVVHPLIILTSSDADNNVCVGEKIDLTAGGANIYQWSTSEDSKSITVDSTGTYSVIGTNLDGCKDTASINIFVNTPFSITENKVICQGQSYKGHLVTENFNENLKSVFGCDSIVTTNLTVNPPYYITENKVICQGHSYKGHTATGNFSENLTSVSGCDSIVMTNLTVTPVHYVTDNRIICQGQSYKGHIVSENFTENLTSVCGCDSTVTTHLTVNPDYSIAENKVICQGISYRDHITSGTYIDKLISTTGCDSIITLNLTVNNTPAPVITLNNDILQSDASAGNQWYLDNNVIQNAINNTLVPLTKGTYYVIVTSNSCPSPTSNIVAFEPRVIKNFSCSSVIDIYPNPTPDFLEIRVKDTPPDKYKIAIYNNFGALMQLNMNQRDEYKVQVNLSNYPSGIYIIKIYDKLESCLSKIIKF